MVPPLPSTGPAPAALDELARALGERAVLRPEPGPDDGLAAYEEPVRGEPGHAAAVVRPATTEEVRTVVRWARDHRVRLLPQGAASGLVGASTPPPDGPPVVVLSTERLVGPVEVDPVDRAAVVPAGVRLSTLNEAAAAHGLEFPIDLGADPALGGMAATNTGGARMLRHGDVRRRVLGIEAVLADESVSVVDTLRVVRKDNTGIDPTVLLVGAGGALGVITRVAVDLSVRPAERACLMTTTTPAAAVDLLVEAERRLDPLLSAFEVLSAPAVRAAVDHVDGVRAPLPVPDGQVLVLVELSGPIGTGDRLADLGPVLDRAGGATAVVPAEDAWRLRHAVTEGLRRSGVVVGFDVAVRRSELPAFLDAARAEVARVLSRATVADFGHWGDGGVHCNVVVPTGEPPPTAEERAELRDAVFGLVTARFGGSFSAEHGIGPHNAGWWRRVTPPAVQDLVRDWRRAADPLGVLGHPELPY